MSKRITGKKVAENMMRSVVVQAISVMIGFVLNLVVPKFISEYDYSYWQTFLLYSQYLSIFHFGFLDGFVLRYAQYDYDELDKKSVRSQYAMILLADAVITVFLLILAFTAFSGPLRVVCALIAVSTCIKITYAFISYTFQTTNRIKVYSMYITVQRILYGVMILGCVFLQVNSYFWYCMVYLAADVAAMLYYGLKYDKELFFGSMNKLSVTANDLKTTLSAGIWLMISAYAANLLVGSGKMVIQWFWDQLTFGKVSLAFSLSSFVLQFVTAISVVLFPTMKRMSPDRLPDMYLKIRNGISPLLFLALILYFPGSVILKLWLPKYAQSIVYLGILMPVIVYTSKVSLLTNNYLKAYRKERLMLIMNVSIVLCAFLTFFLIGKYVQNITVLLCAIVFFIMLRSVIAEIAVMQVIGHNLTADFIAEFIVTVLFIAGVIFLPHWSAFTAYCIVWILYCFFKRKTLLELIRQLRAAASKRRPKEN